MGRITFTIKIVLDQIVYPSKYINVYTKYIYIMVSYLPPYTKDIYRWVTHVSVNAKTVKFIRKTSSWLQSMQDRTQKSLVIQEKNNNKMTHIKIKIPAHQMTTSRKWKITTREDICNQYIIQKRFVFWRHEKYLQNSIEKYRQMISDNSQKRKIKVFHQRGK